MSPRNSRRRGLLLAAASGIVVAAASFAQSQPRRIALSARKFAFEPEEIVVREGERVVLVLTTPDVIHGLSIPDLKVRADFAPGREVELAFIAPKSGRYLYTCDNFCGEGHDDMGGVLIVGA